MVSQRSAVISTSGGIAGGKTITDSFTQFHHLISDHAFWNKINFLGYLINQKQVIAVGANPGRHNEISPFWQNELRVPAEAETRHEDWAVSLCGISLSSHFVTITLTHTKATLLLLERKSRQRQNIVMILGVIAHQPTILPCYPTSSIIILINLIGLRFKITYYACSEVHRIRVIISSGLYDLLYATLYMRHLVRFNACFPHGIPLKQLGGFEDRLYAKMPQAIFTRL